MTWCRSPRSRLRRWSCRKAYVRAQSSRRSRSFAPIAPCFAPGDLPPSWQGSPVLCVASRTDLDRGRCLDAGAVAPQAWHRCKRDSLGGGIDRQSVATRSDRRADVLPISAWIPGSRPMCGFLVRRLRRKFPKTTIVVGFWTHDRDTIRHEIIAGTGVELSVSSLAEALDLVCRTARETKEPVAVRSRASAG